MENIITTSQLLPSLSYTYETPIEKEFGKVFLLPQNHILVCELTAAYVPIEEFKEIFLEASLLIEKHKIVKFVFDKQNLRVFHQPSMEWYFIHWKKDMYAKGLSIHRKVLPQDQPAFNLAVEAGRAKILSEYKDTIIPLLDIQYKATVQEALEQ